jgi:hypothetical protein
MIAATAVSLVATSCGDDDGVNGEATSTLAAIAVPTSTVFDEGLSRELQGVLDAAVGDPDDGFPGAFAWDAWHGSR